MRGGLRRGHRFWPRARIRTPRKRSALGRAPVAVGLVRTTGESKLFWVGDGLRVGVRGAEVRVWGLGDAQSLLMPHKPKLGQNFLTDSMAQAAIVDALGDVSSRTVVEIGPGRGAITSLLA